MRNNSRNISLFVFLYLAFFAFVATASAEHTERMITVAGGYVGNEKPAMSAALAGPIGLAADTRGNIYVSDSLNCQIRKINRKGVISRFAGTGLCGFRGDGRPATDSKISSPAGLALDTQDNLYFADEGNSRIRKITPEGAIFTVAGNGVVGYSGDGGLAKKASLAYPTGVSVDESGNIFIADTNNCVVRMVDTKKIIHTVAGNHTCGFSGDGGPATSAALWYDYDVVPDGNGGFYIADAGNERVRRVDSNGIITTYAGNGQFTNIGAGGPATSAAIGSPAGLLLGAGKLYISSETSVWVVDQSTQTITTAAGNGVQGFFGDGGSAPLTALNTPRGLAFDINGDLLIADSNNNRIRRVDASQTISTIAGGYLGDGGRATEASLNVQSYFGGHMAFDAEGNVYIADSFYHRIRKVSPAGTITTIAGTGTSGYSGDGGPAINAMLNRPYAVAVTSTGDVFIADNGNCAIRKVDTTGTITTVVGNNSFVCAYGLTADSNGNVYAASGFLGNVIYKIAPDGSLSIVAGVLFGSGYNGDGIPATQADLTVPVGVAVDSAGNLYIAEWSGARIRKVDANGIISTMAGNGVSGFSGDHGSATQASINSPLDVAVDDFGNVFIADSGNVRVRMIDTSGTIQTFAGSGGGGYNGEDLPAIKANIFPIAVTAGPEGAIYVTDGGSDRVRKISRDRCPDR